MTNSIEIGNDSRAAKELQRSMEALAEELQKLILALPATSLLGYLWTSFAVQSAMVKESQEEKNDKEERTPSDEQEVSDKDESEKLSEFAFIMEYIHAVLSCNATDGSSQTPLDEQKIENLLKVAKQLREAAQYYCIASSAPNEGGAFGAKTGEIEFFAKTAWISIRGNRNQPLEEEFFQFVLAPHDEALRNVYNIGAHAISSGIQSIATSMRTGLMKAHRSIADQMTNINDICADGEIVFEDALKDYMSENPQHKVEAQQALADFFYGGICNLSVQTQLPPTLLDDLAFSRGGNREFYAPGDFSGTPLRTLPARIRPLIKLDDGYYATDPSFVRDASYRAIQRALISRNPQYREEWNSKQKHLTEHAFEVIFPRQLKAAKIFYEVYYKNPSTGQWVENDALILIDDVLIQVEAKAGLTAMHSPATDFNKQVRAVRELIVKSYYQARRFLEYANSAQSVPLFKLQDGIYTEIYRLSLFNYRSIIPIGLTVESFTPFSAMCKELPEVDPILGRHPFISMSIDDLFVLTKFLPTAGELFHYLEVRQQVAGLRGSMIFDELDHLGAYIEKNRFDMDINKQLSEGVDKVAWTGFSQIVDDYFARDQWQEETPPKQKFPEELSRLFDALSVMSKPGWLKAQTLIRDLSYEGREEFAETLSQAQKTLSYRKHRWFYFKIPEPLMVWLQRIEDGSLSDEMSRQAEALALAINRSQLDVLCIAVNASLVADSASLIQVSAPPRGTRRYFEVQSAAERLRRAFNE